MLVRGIQVGRFWRSVGLFLLGGLTEALLTLVCFRFHVNSTTAGLLFLIVIIVISLKATLLPAALVSILAYICLDYFFTSPLFTLGMNQPLDFVAPVAYLTTAVVITRLMSMVRKSYEEQKRSEETLRKSRAELAHVTRVLTMGELATSIAHEINQPLSAIVTNANACLRWLDGDSPNLEEARAAAGRIVRDGQRAGDVLTHIRALLRKGNSEKVAVDINEVIREVVNLTRIEAQANRVTVNVETGVNLPPVLGDRVQLQQVILNLIMNSIESMAAVTNRERELIVSSLRHETNKVLVSIKDRGVGIDVHALDKIFDAFYTTKGEGMGMGLAISRSIIDDHGGQLWATANAGPGTTFQFTLLQYE